MSFEEDDTAPEVVQFPIRFLFGAITFIALFVGVLAVAMRARNDKRRMQAEAAELQLRMNELERDLLKAQGEGMRTVFAEKLLFHVLGHSDEYPEIVKALQNYEQRNLGVAVHGLGNDDNLSYLNLYPVQSSKLPPFCHTFLVHEEPFEVVDYVQGEQSRYPRKLEGEWVCGAGLNGEDRWYTIDATGFLPLEKSEQNSMQP
jgi:hypothetical protein